MTNAAAPDSKTIESSERHVGAQRRYVSVTQLVYICSVAATRTPSRSPGYPSYCGHRRPFNRTSRRNLYHPTFDYQLFVSQSHAVASSTRTHYRRRTVARDDVNPPGSRKLPPSRAPSDTTRGRPDTNGALVGPYHSSPGTLAPTIQLPATGPRVDYVSATTRVELMNKNTYKIRISSSNRRHRLNTRKDSKRKSCKALGCAHSYNINTN